IRTPTYHVFEMNKGHHDATLLPLHIKDRGPVLEIDEGRVHALSASATRTEREALVSVTNLDPAEPGRLEVDIRGTGWQPASARILTAPQLAAHNTADAPDTVVPREFDGARKSGDTLVVELPPHS